MLLQAQDATVAICHSGTERLADICRGAGILVAAAGQAEMVDCSFLSPDQVIIDVGASLDGNGKLLGDVRFDEAEPVAAAITPVPGGVGAVTTAVLCGHVVEAAEGADGISGKIPGRQYL